MVGLEVTRLTLERVNTILVNRGGSGAPFRRQRVRNRGQSRPCGITFHPCATLQRTSGATSPRAQRDAERRRAAAGSVFSPGQAFPSPLGIPLPPPAAWFRHATPGPSARMSADPPFWQHCLHAFREELTPQQFNTWIRPLALESVTGGYRLLGAESLRSAMGEGSLPRPHLGNRCAVRRAAGCHHPCHHGQRERRSPGRPRSGRAEPRPRAAPADGALLGHVHAARIAAPARADEPQPVLHLRHVRRAPRINSRARQRCRSPNTRHPQPAVRLRRGGTGQRT